MAYPWFLSVIINNTLCNLKFPSLANELYDCPKY